MSDSCCPPDPEKKEDELDEVNSLSETCPQCGNKSRSVSHTTLYHMLEPVVAREVSPEVQYRVCSTRTCTVVYYGKTKPDSFTREDLRVRVGFKLPEGDSPHPVCYCFGYTEETIAEEMERSGESTVVEWISRRVQAGDCACVYKNPTGRCCLSDVNRAVEQARLSRTPNNS